MTGQMKKHIFFDHEFTLKQEQCSKSGGNIWEKLSGRECMFM